jgi:nicotinate phosphoribosyltransferase
MVYKLVARTDDDGLMVGVAKKSKDKASVAGRKYALRRRNAKGVAEAEVLGIGEPPVDDGDDRALLVPLMAAGRTVSTSTLEDARERHAATLAELPRTALRLQRGEPAIPTVYEE